MAALVACAIALSTLGVAGTSGAEGLPAPPALHSLKAVDPGGIHRSVHADEASLVNRAAMLRAARHPLPAQPRPPVQYRQATDTSNSSTGTTSSANWSGYDVGGGPFTAVQGTFTVPSLYAGQSNTDMSEWVGIDGVYDTSLIQAGINEFPDPSNSSMFYILPWWEILPADQTPITTMSVGVGDQVTVTIQEVSTGEWSITVDDSTDGQSFTTDQPYSAALSSAEWIVEAPTVNGTISTLADYSPTSFSNLGISGTQTSLTELVMVQNGVQVSTPSAITSSGFTVTYGTPTPTPTPTQASGYDILTSNGGVSNFDAPWYGSPKASGETAPGVVGIAAAPGGGYDVLRANGGVFSYGTTWRGSLVNQLPAGVTPVGIAADPTTDGYYILTSNGGVFNFDTPWYGSPKASGDTTSAVTGISAAPGGGYDISQADGNVLAFGTPGHGSLAGDLPSGTTAISIAAT